MFKGLMTRVNILQIGVTFPFSYSIYLKFSFVVVFHRRLSLEDAHDEWSVANI
jgi:hypothetical protein